MPQALYRKYRPKKLEDVLGQDTNVEILQNAAKAGRLGQAYIFYGARGTGKTTTARLIAKLLNCEKRRSDPKFAALGEPCNECRECLAVDAQNSLDVIEIDAASNRGIDEIRNLKDSIKTSPASGAYKVYIIDEAHMLTGAAFNALLKTLEEPPKHAVIIMATTEFEKLPPTITSRAQRFVFRKQSKVTIMEKLSTIAAAEKITIDPAALELIAAVAEGSFRDAESLLEQISSVDANAKGITLDDAERITGRTGLRKVHALAALIVAKDLKGALMNISELNDEGHNLVQFTKDLIHYLRKTLSLSVNPALEATFEKDLTHDEIAAVKKLAAGADTAALVKLIKALIRAYAEMRYSPFAVVPLEVMLVEQLSA
jgi:DNA polymerase-3 subunit gamma/tau